MQTREFGSTGQQVARIGQGTWQIKDHAHAQQALLAGVDLGATHIDTAELYTGSEQTIGRSLAQRREELFLVSKVLPSHASYQGTLDACDATLERLATDHLDVYLLHWWSRDHPIEDTMRAMGELADEGKTRFVGVSNLDVEQLEQAQQALGDRHRIACDQVFYHLGARDIESQLLPYCRQKNIALVGYSPFLSGRFPPAGQGAHVLKDVAAAHGATIHQVVLNFLLRDPQVFQIPKAERVEHVQQNVKALDFTLAPEQIQAVDDAFPAPDARTSLPTI